MPGKRVLRRLRRGFRREEVSRAATRIQILRSSDPQILKSSDPQIKGALMLLLTSHRSNPMLPVVI